MNTNTNVNKQLQNAVKAYVNKKVEAYAKAANNANVKTKTAISVPSEQNANKAALANGTAAESAQNVNEAVNAAKKAGVPLPQATVNKINGAVNNQTVAVKNFAKLIANAQNNAALNAIGADPNLLKLPSNNQNKFKSQINARKGVLAMPQI